MATKNFYVIDALDKMFCKCDGVTTSFVDSSLSPKTITANGNATQLPIKFNKSAGFFNGTTDYLDIASNAAFAPAKTAFDIEFLVNFTSTTYTTAGIIIDTRTVATNATGMSLYVDSSKHLVLVSGASAKVTGATTLAINTWYHVRVQGNGGADGARTLKVYLDNTQEGSTSTFDYNFTDTTLRIGGQYQTAAYFLSGWLKELRWSNVARTVAVPTAQYTSDANTVLLMHFDTPATSPLGPWINFPTGTNNYLYNTGNLGITGTGDFTLEAFITPTGVSGTQGILRTHNGSPTGIGFGYNHTNTRFQLVIEGTTLNYTYTLVNNRTYHVAAVRKAGKAYVFVNGVSIDAGQNNSGNVTNGVAYIGVDGATFWIGNIREIRYSKSGRYDSQFTPSQTGWVNDADTVLYVKGNENNGAVAFTDSSTTPKAITTVANAKIIYAEDYRSCIFKDETGKFPYPVGSAKVNFFAIGSGVGYFDGTNSKLTMDASADFAPAKTAFVWETYFRLKVVALQIMIYTDFAGTAGMDWYTNASSQLTIANGNTEIVTGTTVLLANRWYHGAIVGNGGADGARTIKMYLDGTQEGSTYTANYDFTNQTLVIGNYSTSFFNGLLDNIRISKGVARYTASFNPPEFASLPNIKAINSLASENIKAINGLEVSSIKSILGI